MFSEKAVERRPFKYITGINEKQKHKLYIINGMDDHLHCLISMAPTQSPSELMYHVKRSSSLWINNNKFVPEQFSWQDGFGAFSLGKAQLSGKIAYIENQQEHHRKTSFREEYIEFLRENDINFDEKYIFKPIRLTLKLLISGLFIHYVEKIAFKFVFYGY